MAPEATVEQAESAAQEEVQLERSVVPVVMAVMVAPADWELVVESLDSVVLELFATLHIQSLPLPPPAVRLWQGWVLSVLPG